MSTGFSGGSVFGIPDAPEGRVAPPGSSAPSPADLARGRSSLPSDAANGEGGGKGREPAPELLVDDRATRRRRKAAIGAILTVLAVASLFIDAGYATFFDPGEVFGCYGIWFQQAYASLFSPGDVVQANALIADHPAYFRIINRVGTTLMTIIAGAVLAISGSLYQSAFRNPIAGPSMLGVSSAIQLGDAILVVIFGELASTQLGWRYAICYSCVIVVMALLFTFARLMSGKRRSFNVVNLLLVAMILTQIIGVVATYITLYVFTWDMWEAYNMLSESITVNLDLLSWIVFLISCLVGLVPVMTLRFRLNGLNFDDTEMRLLGVNATRLRLLALLCGTVLLMAAQVQMGTVAMLSLVVPHVSRMVFGAEFRKQLAGNVLIGAALLVLCRDIVGFIPFVGNFLPISVVLNFLVLPFFVWMLATQQRGWEQ